MSRLVSTTIAGRQEVGTQMSVEQPRAGQDRAVAHTAPWGAAAIVPVPLPIPHLAACFL